MKVLVQYSLRKGFTFIVDEVSEDILKSCQSWRQVKEEYLKSKGLSIMDIRNWELQIPTDMQDEED